MAAELVSISVSCFFVAGVFYSLWWTDETLVIPTAAGCILFAVCTCIKIAMGHTISPSIHGAITMFYASYFMIQYAKNTQTFIETELPSDNSLRMPVMSKIEASIRICFTALYLVMVMWSRLYIGANTTNEVVVGILLGTLFILLEYKITPLLLLQKTRKNNESEKFE